MATGTSNKNYPPITPETYRTNIPADADFNFVSAHTIFPYLLTAGSTTVMYPYSDEYTQEIYENDNTTPIFTNTYRISGNDNTGRQETEGQDIGYTVIPSEGTIYRIIYTFKYSELDSNDDFTNTVQYTITAVNNLLSFKKLTVKDVLLRLLDVAEPIRRGESPRYVLDENQAVKFDNILAPQFSFTKQTLRECLQEVGGFIHGEPRITPVQNDDGGWVYKVDYHFYGNSKKSITEKLPYYKGTVSQLIESYCTNIDSNAENLVNAIAETTGSLLTGQTATVTEPYEGGFKTVRTDSFYARIDDGNMLCETMERIYGVREFWCGIIPDNEGAGQLFDLTPYVFEASEYNTRLSSYTSAYPYSKAYGIMFTQGQKNIVALNFKQDNPISPVFENYAIINILEQVSGQKISTGGTNFYPRLAFRIKYTPFYSSRVSQTKPNYTEFSRPSALVYNQGSNIIESRYYGENIKGVVSRLGNIEQTRTYKLARLGFVPEAGMKFDDDYNISAVYKEIFPDCINITLGLTKNLNPISKYVGISSVKRYSEVSQTQAVERNILEQEYVVIGDSLTPDADCYLGDNFMRAISATFSAQSAEDFKPLTNVVAWGTSAQGNALPAVQLPVISSAFGNAISFEWRYADNYSAGAISEYAEGNDVSGYFQNNYRYTDYYGRIYYYNFDLQQSGVNPQNIDEQTQIGTSLPAYTGTLPATSSGYFSTVGRQPRLLRKDNREIIKVNAQIDFVTNRKHMIIGSALAAGNPLVSGNGAQGVKLYAFTERLDRFINHLTGSVDVNFINQTLDGNQIQIPDLPNSELSITDVDNGQFSIALAGGVLPGESGVQYKAWAIVTPQISHSEQVEDEQGNVTAQTVQYGGDVLLAQNMDFSAGDSFPPIYFTKKREVFDKSVWIANR